MKIHQINVTNKNDYTANKRANYSQKMNRFNMTTNLSTPTFGSFLDLNLKDVLEKVNSIADNAKAKVDSIFHKNSNNPKTDKTNAKNNVNASAKNQQVKVQNIEKENSLIPAPKFSLDFEAAINILKDNETKIDLEKQKPIRDMLRVIVDMSSFSSAKHNAEYNKNVEFNREIFIDDLTKLYAQEKAEYIKSIWMSHIKYYPHLNEIPKDKRVAGLKALQEYGTRDDLLRLNRENNDCITSKDSEIFIEYVKFVRKVGSTSGKIDEYDYSLVRGSVNRKITETYNEETIEEILKTLKHFMIDNTIPGEFKNASWEEYKRFEKLSHHSNKTIAEHARLLMNRLKADNPWM